MTQLPQPFLDFSRAHADVVSAYEARLEGAVHAHARRALAAGATPVEIQHVVTLAIPTVGFPTTIAAFTWVGDVLSGQAKGPTGGPRSGSSR